MVIEVISSNTIKVILNQDDMLSFDVSFEKLDRSNSETKRMLREIISNIKSEKDIDLSNEKLFVEAFPKGDDGCLLYLSSLSSSVKVATERGAIYNTLICKITSPQTLMQICTRICESYNHIIHNSELYYNDGVYQMIFQIYRKTDKKLKTMLNEYCEISGTTEIEASVIREHYSCVFAINAIEETYQKQVLI